MPARNIVALCLFALACFAAGYGLRAAASTSRDSAGSTSSAAGSVTALAPPRPPVKLAATDASRYAEWARLCSRASTTGDWGALMRSAEGRAARELIAERWARKDPAACWAYLLESSRGRRPDAALAEIVVLLWAESEPISAMAAAAGLPVKASANAPDVRRDLIWKTMRHALLSDIALLPELLVFTYGNNGIGWGGSDIWVKADPEQATRQLAKLPDTHFRKAIGQAAREWFKREPGAALAFVKSLAPGPQRIAAEHIGRELKEQDDFETARELAESARSGELRGEIAYSFLSTWGEKDPLAAASWAAEQFQGERQTQMVRDSLGSAAFRVITSNRDGPPWDFSQLTAVAESLSDRPARDGAAKGILKTWGNRDPAAAFAWYLEMEERGEIGYAALGSLSDNFGGAELSKEWFATAPDHPFVDTAFRHLISRMEADSLLELAKTLPPERAERALEVVAGRK